MRNTLTSSGRISRLQRLWHWVAAFGVLLVVCAAAPSYAATISSPTAKAGVLAAPNWDLTQDGPLELSGEWQVVWGQLVPPDEFLARFQGHHFLIPARWDDVPQMGSAFGTATFRLKLDVPRHPRPARFHMIAAHSAYRVFVNGEMMIENGRVGDGPLAFHPNYVTRVFAAETGTSEIVLQVANYSHAHGGPGHAVELWDAAALDASLQTYTVIYSVIVGVMAMIGLFHLILYAADRKDKAHAAIHFWFALLCFVIVYRAYGIIPYFHLHFPEALIWDNLRGVYLSLYAAPIVYLMFFQALFPAQFPRRVTQGLVGFAALLLLYTLVVDEYRYTQIRDIAIGLNVLSITYSLIFTLRAVKARELGGVVILLTNLVFLGTAANDALIYTERGQGFDMTPIGVLVLGLGYSYALLLRLQRRFRKARETSAALEGLNRDLEGQVEQRTRSFQAAAASAENSARDQARFIAAASHDLRQPLHALAMFNAALARQLAGSPQADLVAKQTDAIEGLGGLLQDTLDTARIGIDGKAADPATFEVAGFLEEIKNSHQAKAHEAGIALWVECGQGELTSDRTMLRRVLSNLIDNAIKAAKKQVRVDAREQPSGWQFKISDDGNGIAQQDIERIFESYVTLSDQDGYSGGGYGLGLYVVKEFCRVLGVDISVESTIGAGSTFTLAAPLRPLLATPREHLETPDPDVDLRGVQILAVDDERDVLTALGGLLEAWGATFKGVSDMAGVKAVLAAGYMPAILIADYHLYGENGVDLAEAVCRMQSPPPAVLIITGATGREDLQVIEQAGFTLLTKPVEPAVLGAKIVELVQLSA